MSREEYRVGKSSRNLDGKTRALCKLKCLPSGDTFLVDMTNVDANSNIHTSRPVEKCFLT